MDTIIIQDADRDILEILKAALEMEDFKVYTVTGRENNLISMIRRLDPQLILLDYLLDGRDCIQICREIKTLFPQLPVLIMSCNNHIKDVFKQQGFDDCIEKPFDLEDLYSVIRKYISPQTSQLHLS